MCRACLVKGAVGLLRRLPVLLELLPDAVGRRHHHPPLPAALPPGVPAHRLVLGEREADLHAVLRDGSRRVALPEEPFRRGEQHPAAPSVVGHQPGVHEPLARILDEGVGDEPYADRRDPHDPPSSVPLRDGAPVSLCGPLPRTRWGRARGRAWWLPHRAAPQENFAEYGTVRTHGSGGASVDWLFIVKPADTASDGGSSSKDRMLELAETAPRREWCLSRWRRTAPGDRLWIYFAAPL